MGKRINGHLLPDAVIELITAGRWNPPSDEKIEAGFGERPSRPAFYSLEDMEFENKAWIVESSLEYIGLPSDELPPGDIDPKRSVLIGDLGHDRPFALDYRDSAEHPRVVLLVSSENGGWLRIAESAEELLVKLGLVDQLAGA